MHCSIAVADSELLGTLAAAGANRGLGLGHSCSSKAQFDDCEGVWTKIALQAPQEPK